MRIRVISIGKVKTDYLSIGIADFVHRLKRFCNLELIVIKDSTTSKESEQILKKISNEFVVALDVNGVLQSSVDLSKKLLTINKDIVFIIGNENGIDAKIKNRANMLLSLSKMTFTHEMARLFLLEQIYRAFMINSGRSYYHK